MIKTRRYTFVQQGCVQGENKFFRLGDNQHNVEGRLDWKISWAGNVATVDLLTALDRLGSVQEMYLVRLVYLVHEHHSVANQL